MTTNIHALRRIETHGLSVQVTKVYTSDHATTGTSDIFNTDTEQKWRERRSKPVYSSLNVVNIALQFYC
jgi:hypothetical protein